MTAPRPDGGADADVVIAWCLHLSDGTMSPQDRERLHDWLAGDAARGEQLGAALAAWDAVEADADAPEMLALRRDALGAVHRAGQRRWLRTRIVPSPIPWARPMLWAIAATLVLTLSVSSLLWWQGGRDAYRTGIGERRVIALADGSRLSLDADSVVTVAFTAQRRNIVLEQGRARFKVAKDPLRPFAVRSGRNVIVATGTEFSVERLSREVRVALFEGHVAVLRDTPQGQTNEIVRRDGRRLTAERALTPGHEIGLPVSGTIGSIGPAIGPIAGGESWGAEQISFTAETLGAAAERMNRYAEGRRIAVDPGVADVRISGVFNIGDVDAFAQAIAATFPVDAAVDDTTIRLKRHQ
jgi:transmembrane sensor